MIAPSRSARARGFTLIELLVALVLAALLMLLLTQLVGDLGRTWSRGGIDADPRSRVLDDADLLRQLVAGLQPIGPRRGYDLAGDASGFRATIAAPAALRDDGIVRMTAKITGGQGVMAVKVELSPAEGLPIAVPVPKAPHLLFPGSRALALSYFPQGWTGHPVGRWSSMKLPPRAIILRVETAAGEKILIAMPIAANVPAGCVFDPVSLACR